ncbi:hypothetical protein D3C80_391620 [compost metagenome]
MKGEGTGLSPVIVYPVSCVDQGHPSHGHLFPMRRGPHNGRIHGQNIQLMPIRSTTWFDRKSGEVSDLGIALKTHEPMSVLHCNISDAG